MCWRRTERARELEDAGHVQVAADPADGHSCLVTLTPAGARRAAADGPGRPGPVRLFVADWQPGDVRMLTALLDKLRNSIATPNSEPPGAPCPA
jgi:DNA-binding MarR family transcriptional regulator